MLWRQAALIWRAKGYTHTEAADALEARFGRNKGFSRSRITVLATLQCEPCPQEVAEFLLNDALLKVRDAKRWAQFDRELTAIREGDTGPAITPRDLREVAQEATSSLADLVRAWLDTAGSTLTAFASTGSALLSGLASKLDGLSAQLDHHSTQLNRVGGKLDSQGAKLDSQGTQLATLQMTLNGTDATALRIDAKMDSSEAQRRKDKRQMMAVTVGTGLAVIASVGLALWQQARNAASRAPVQNITVRLGTAERATRSRPRTAPIEFDLETLLGAIASGEMGKKAPEEQFIPDGPLPGQKRPPCDDGLGEDDVNGGCWGSMAKVKPPCGRLFRHGDLCYRPIAADPSKPVGLVPKRPGQEQQQPQH